MGISIFLSFCRWFGFIHSTFLLKNQRNNPPGAETNSTYIYFYRYFVYGIWQGSSSCGWLRRYLHFLSNYVGISYNFIKADPYGIYVWRTRKAI